MAQLSTRPAEPALGAIHTSPALARPSPSPASAVYPGTTDEVESPSLSSACALARFEFESGRTSNDGTKILLVEWEDDDTTRALPGEWHITWKDRESVLPANDQKHHDVHRLYFLLGPGHPVPPAVTLNLIPTDPSHKSVTWKTNPLPAIFPPELGATARAAGKKGVLHTLWAKSRLAALQTEIEAEYLSNAEGIALEMMLQEKQWIEENFGVLAKPASSAPKPLRMHSDDSAYSHGGRSALSARPMGPPTPRSPGVGRFLDKLGGLRLDTKDSADTNGTDMPTTADEPDMPPLTSVPYQPNPLSPDSSDVAVSSFASIKGTHPRFSASAPLTTPPTAQKDAAPVLFAPVRPPPQSGPQPSGMGSLASVLSGPPPAAAPPSASSLAAIPSTIPDFLSNSSQPPQDVVQEEEKDEDLFALPMSPRQDVGGKNPFSFAAGDMKKQS